MEEFCECDGRFVLYSWKTNRSIRLCVRKPLTIPKGTNVMDRNVMDRNVMDRNVMDRNIMDRNVMDRNKSIRSAGWAYIAGWEALKLACLDISHVA